MVFPGSNVMLGWSECLSDVDVEAQLAWDDADPHLLEVRWWAAEPIDGEEVLMAVQTIEARDADDARRLMETALADPDDVRTWEDGNGSDVCIGNAEPVAWIAEMTECPSSWDAMIGAAESEDAIRRKVSLYWSHLTEKERAEVGGIRISRGEREDAMWPSTAHEVRECCPSERVTTEDGEDVWIYDCPGGWFVDDIEEFDNGEVPVQDVLLDRKAARIMASEPTRKPSKASATATVRVRQSGGSMVLNVTSALKAIDAGVGDYVQVTIHKME